MFRIEQQREKNPKIVVIKQITTNEGDIYERTGLWLVIKLFHFFGFRLLNDPETQGCVNRWYLAAVVVDVFFCWGTGFYIMSCTLVKSDGSMDLEYTGVYGVMGLSFFVTLVVYSMSVVKVKNMSVLMRSLSSAIDDIPDQERKEQIVGRFKKYFYLLCMPCIVIGAVLSLLTVYFNHEAGMSKYSFHILNLFSIVNTFWFLSVGCYYFFTNVLILAICKFLNAIIEVYLNQEIEPLIQVKDVWTYNKRENVLRDEDIERNMFFHQKICALVEKTNAVIAHFMLISLALEILTCIVIVKMITIKNGAFSFAAYVFSPNILLLVLKAFACANVNDKLKSSMLLKKLPNPKDFSNEQVSYMLYMDGQNISKTELTYGNIFPVTKTFIFTIAGTVLTYALVLQGLDQSS